VSRWCLWNVVVLNALLRLSPPSHVEKNFFPVPSDRVVYSLDFLERWRHSYTLEVVLLAPPRVFQCVSLFSRPLPRAPWLTLSLDINFHSVRSPRSSTFHDLSFLFFLPVAIGTSRCHHASYRTDLLCFPPSKFAYSTIRRALYDLSQNRLLSLCLLVLALPP